MEELAPYDARVTRTPDDAKAYLSRGMCHMRNGTWVLAKADFEKALTLPLDADRPPDERGMVHERPEEAECRLQLGAAKVELGDLAGAEEDMDAGVKMRPGEPAYTARGAVRVLRGALEGGLADLNRALELDPSSARALRHRARCHERMGNLEAAELDLSRALSAYPLLEPSLTQWKALRERLGKGADPFVDVPRPASVAGLYARACALRTNGAHAPAVDDFTALLALPGLDPRYVTAIRQLRGQSLVDLGRTEEAMADLGQIAGGVPAGTGAGRGEGADS